MTCRVLCDGLPLLDLRDDDLILINPEIKLEVNTIGEGSFTIYSNHPYYKDIRKLKSVFEVSDDFGTLFRGRMTEDSSDFDNGLFVDLEGAMSYFNDSIVRPYSFPEDFLDDADYITASQNGNVIAFYLGWLISQHNAQVDEFQRFKFGDVTVKDPNNYLSRADSSYPSTWKVLEDKLFKSDLGGYLCIRYEDDGNYIDYLESFTLTNPQKIEFGENLLDIKHDSSGTETYSAIIPLGADGLTIATLPDGNITDDLIKSGDMIYSVKARANYGLKIAPVEETTWDDVNTAANLQSNGVKFMGNAIMFAETIEITAADLHYTDDEIQSFRIYRKTQVESVPHGITDAYDLTRLNIPLLNPQSMKITMGATKLTLTESNRKENVSNTQRIEIVEKDIAENRAEITEAEERIITEMTGIRNDSKTIVLEAMSDYVSNTTFEEYKSHAETSINVTSGKIDLLAEKTTEDIKRVSDENGETQKQVNEIALHMQITAENVAIGRPNSDKRIVMDDDTFAMQENNIDVLTLENGGANVEKVFVRDEMHLFGAYKLEMDDKGRMNCTYIRG